MMTVRQQITNTRKSRLKNISKIIKEAKNDVFLTENSKKSLDRKKVYLSEINKNIRSYYAYALMEVALNRGVQLVTPEDATLGQLINVIAVNNSGNEIGRYLGRFNHVVTAILTLQVGVGKQAEQTAGKFAGTQKPGTAGYGSGGFSPTVGGGIREQKTISMLSHPSISPKLKAEFEKGEAEGKLDQKIKNAMEVLEKDLPKVADFLLGYFNLFQDEEKANKLVSAQGAGFLKKLTGGDTSGLIKKAFANVEGFDAEALAKDIKNNPDIVTKNVKFVEKHYGEFVAVQKIEQHILGTIKKTVGQQLKDIFSFGGGGSPSPSSRRTYGILPSSR